MNLYFCFDGKCPHGHDSLNNCVNDCYSTYSTNVLTVFCAKLGAHTLCGAVTWKNVPIQIKCMVMSFSITVVSFSEQLVL